MIKGIGKGMFMRVFELAEIFSDGMIFQRDQPIHVYGTAFQPCDLRIEFDRLEIIQTVGKGFFDIALPSHTAGKNYRLIIESLGTTAQKQILRDVYCGEVWVAGGQSNMAMSLKDTEEYKENPVIPKKEEIRFFTVGRNAFSSPEDFGEGYEWAFCEDRKWDSCNEESALCFSAAAYHFAQEIYRDLSVPIGIINCNVGGSGIFSWMSEDALQANPDLEETIASYQRSIEKNDVKTEEENFHRYLDQYRSDYREGGNISGTLTELPCIYFEEKGRYSFKRPSCLYHGMLSKITRFGVKGMIWYQGESEAFAECAPIYKSAMKSLVTMLIRESARPSYSFQFVQLAPWDCNDAFPWADICNAQREFFLENPQYGMITIGDCGGGEDIHPPKKKAAGQRLAYAALNNAYGMAQEFTGPVAVSAAWTDSRIKIDFIHHHGMHVKEPIGRFIVRYSDDTAQEENAQLVCPVVYVDCDRTRTPRSVEYEYNSNPLIGLFNDSGIPAGIFKISMG